MIPVIESDRVRLRAFREADLDAQASVMARAEVVRYLSTAPLGREDTWRRMLMTNGLWAALGYGYWAVEAKEDKRLIGQVGFADFKRDMDPLIEGLPEMGWIFAPEAWGKGYCSEAVAAALGWASRTHNWNEIVAIIDPENGPSIRVAERAGFTGREDATYRGEPILLFRRYGDQRP